MIFHVDFPVFIIVNESMTEAVRLDLLNGEAKEQGVAVFTDLDGAREFRDGHHRGAKIGTLPDEVALADVLIKMKKKYPDISEVVFDPYRIGKRIQSITLSEMLAQLPKLDDERLG